MNSYTTLVPYRDNTAIELIPIDSEDVVIGLQSLGVIPVDAKTDGRKLIMDFAKDEVAGPFQRIQASLAGATTRIDSVKNLNQMIVVKLDDGSEISVTLLDLFVSFYNRLLQARFGWKGLLTMMRSVPVK